MIMVFVVHTIQGQTRTGFDGYYYTGAGAGTAIVPRLYWQSAGGWYGEARYNYESGHSFSLYAGRTFAREGAVSWSFTPMLGIVGGRFRGGSLGSNATVDVKRVSFSSDLQYTASSRSSDESFFFSWSELGYHLTGHLYAGLVLQHTCFSQIHNSVDPGLQVTLSAGDWQFPAYIFSPQGGQRYCVVGVSREWAYGKTINHTKVSNNP